MLRSTAAGAGDPNRRTDKSAVGFTWVVEVSLLLLRSKSIWSAVTLALLIITSANAGLTTSVTVAEAPLGSVPSSQMTTPFRFVQTPWVADADTRPRLRSKASVSFTLVAGLGP